MPKLEIMFDKLERFEQIAQDTKKCFVYIKGIGEWAWYDKDEADNLHAWHEGFKTRYDALMSAIEPYIEDEGE